MKAVKACESAFKNKSMSRTRDDVAVCIIDVDRNSLDDIQDAINYAEKKKILLIISNPCFEVFFMLHYKDNIPNISSAEMKTMLSEFIEGYEETGDYWELLLEKRDDAIKRARAFTLSVDSIRQGIIGSNIYELFDLIERMKKKN